MKLYQIRKPRYKTTMAVDVNASDVYYAEATAVEMPSYSICSKCGYYKDYLPIPSKRVIEWLPGSNIIGDFTWVARLVAEILVSNRVRILMENVATGIDFIPVEFWQEPKVHRPKKITMRNNPRVWLPYEGPNLSVLWINAWLHADIKRSTLSLKKDCSHCRQKAYEIMGIEELSYIMDNDSGEEVMLHKPRINNQVLFISGNEIGDSHIFRLYERSGAIFCTQKFKELAEKNDLTNMSFLEVGDTL